MTLIEELTQMKKNLEAAQAEQIRLETQMQMIEKELMEVINTSDPVEVQIKISELREKVSSGKAALREGIDSLVSKHTFLRE